MTRLLATIAIVAFAALPTLAIAQNDPSTDPMMQEQAEPRPAPDVMSGDGGGDDLRGDGQSADDAGATIDGTNDGATDDTGTPETGTPPDGMASDDGTSPGERRTIVDPDTITAEEIEGAPVLSRDGDSIATVSEVLFSEDGSIDSLIVNVGGFLGIGSKPVEVPFDRVNLQSDEDGGALRVVLPMSQQELEDMPAYDAG